MHWKKDRHLRKTAASAFTVALLAGQLFVTAVGPAHAIGPLCQPTDRTILDNGEIAITGIFIDVPADHVVTDVDVGVRILHGNVGDLSFEIFDPSATGVVLSSNNGGSGDDYGTGNDCDNPTRFSSDALTPITAGVAPFTGTYLPEGDLDAFIGAPARGIWLIQFEDDVPNAISGFVDAVEFTVSTAGPPPPPPTADLRTQKTCTPTGPLSPRQNVSCTITVTNLGPNPAENVKVTDNLPAGVLLASGPTASGGGTCVKAANLPNANPDITCSFGTLGVNGSRTVSYTIKAPNSVGTSFTNAARSSSTTADPNPGNNAASVTRSTRGCTITGSAGTDLIMGTAGNDVICTFGGDDSINAQGGFDIIDAGPGFDKCLHGEQVLNCERVA